MAVTPSYGAVSNAAPSRVAVVFAPTTMFLTTVSPAPRSRMVCPSVRGVAGGAARPPPRAAVPSRDGAGGAALRLLQADEGFLKDGHPVRFLADDEAGLVGLGVEFHQPLDLHVERVGDPVAR